MTNKEISNQFTLLSRLMDVHGENSFRSKTYSVAGYRISQIPAELSKLAEKEIYKISGIGEATGQKIMEILRTGSMEILSRLLEKTPPGILEMMKIKGIGPKKIHVIWKVMEIESVGELLYACQENRLLLYKGFGKKTQENVMASIEYYLSHLGSYLYAQIEAPAQMILKELKTMFSINDISVTGDFIRQEETIDLLEYVIPESLQIIENTLKSQNHYECKEKGNDYLVYLFKETLKVKLYASGLTEMGEKVLETTGPKEFVTTFKSTFPNINYSGISEETTIFKIAGIQYIPPFLREEKEIITRASKCDIPEVIVPEDIKGIIHCHSNWSDGSNTLQQLAEMCIKTGKEYLVISDHSKSATYAQGLTEERILAQHAAIDELNKQYYPFRIFKGIESDILGNGDLDYHESLMSSFEVVIASVHANLRMAQDKAMMRLIKAIENPYTTILGHMTGRLLLSRPGYPLDHKKIIDACAANNVVIEINANPRRLDMAWEWIPYALSKEVLLSINPDAHSLPEFENTRYGVLAAQKGMLAKKNNLSSFTLSRFEDFLKTRRAK